VPAENSNLHTRSECLQRYRDKKQRRHFSHKVRPVLWIADRSHAASLRITSAPHGKSDAFDMQCAPASVRRCDTQRAS
jgi:hypothetical protein